MRLLGAGEEDWIKVPPQSQDHKTAKLRWIDRSQNRYLNCKMYISQRPVAKALVRTVIVVQLEIIA